MQTGLWFVLDAHAMRYFTLSWKRALNSDMCMWTESDGDVLPCSSKQDASSALLFPGWAGDRKEAPRENADGGKVTAGQLDTSHGLAQGSHPIVPRAVLFCLRFCSVWAAWAPHFWDIEVHMCKL